MANFTIYKTELGNLKYVSFELKSATGEIFTSNPLKYNTEDQLNILTERFKKDLRNTKSEF